MNILFLYRKFPKASPGLFMITIMCTLISLFYLLCLNNVEPNELGMARNHISGKTWVQKPGWHISHMWVGVANINAHPVRVGVPTSGRGFSAKLVQFVPEYANIFLEREGWRYYWWDNRISFNFGHSDEYRGFRNLLLGYAYAKENPKFLKILEEYEF